ncbi:MAG: efflux RND transporter periplasmic adaptor subunit [Xanthomonadales bacterium]|nr:efflux RND transporter periplasmic adaptor subunit [Xanthomonadales bacterium]
MNKLRAIGTTVIGAALIGATVWMVAGLLSDNRSEATVPRGAGFSVPVVTAPVAFEAEDLKLDAVGTSRAIRSVTLYPEAAGEVVAVRFEAGQPVEAGDLLVELDARDEKLALQLAEVRIADAERVLARYSRAEGTDAVPITDREAAQTTLATARIERDRAQVALDDRYIRAPFSGVVGLTDVEPGDRIDPSVAITTLDDRSSLLVSFEVPELMLNAVREGQEIEVTTWNKQGPTASGEVVELGSRIDPVTRTATARARVENPQDQLRPGMSFRVKLRIEGDAYPVVPEVALQWGADGAYVWTVQDGKAARVGADIVQRRAGRVLVEAELSEGTPIVVEGVQSMREGRQVELTDSRGS